MIKTMSRITCDRCSTETDFEAEDVPVGSLAKRRPDGWQTLSYRFQGADGDTYTRVDGDLCPACATNFGVWFLKQKELAPHGSAAFVEKLLEKRPAYSFEAFDRFDDLAAEARKILGLEDVKRHVLGDPPAGFDPATGNPNEIEPATVTEIAQLETPPT